MYIKLQPTELVNNFMSELPNMKFIPQIPSSDYGFIRKSLDILSNIKNGKQRNYSRNIKTKSAIILWKYFFGHAFKSITQNHRGYHDLLDYFDQYAHYENVLFALDKKHRDHVIHSVWVMLIGFYLMKKSLR